MPEDPEYYKIVSSHNAASLEASVNPLIEDGWRPLGNIVITLVASRSSSYTDYTQALVQGRGTPQYKKSSR